MDVWEDDSSMRRRFVHNPYGQRHSISSSNEKRTTKNLGEEQIEIKKDEDLNKLLKDLARKMIASGGVSKTNNILQQFVDETEIERLIREEENSNSVNASANNSASENKNGKIRIFVFFSLKV